MFLVVFLMGCDSKVTEGDTSKISKGMSENEVIEILGKPTIETTDRNDLQSTYDEFGTLYAVNVEFDEDKEDSNSGWTELGEFKRAVEEKRNVKVYDYKLADKKRIIINFLDNKVSFFYELDLKQ